MKIIYSIVPLMLLALFLPACNEAEAPATGLENEIFVVADSLEYEELKPELEKAFEKIIYTPQPEKLFTLTRIPANRLEEYQKNKNILLIAPQNSNSSTAQFIKAIADSAAKYKIEKEKGFIIKKYDLWAKDQLVMLLTAGNMEELKARISENSGSLMGEFQKISDKRLHESLYDPKFEQKNMEGHFLKDYSWVMYVQADYKIVLESPENNFVLLRCMAGEGMTRWIAVHWIDNASPVYLNEDSIKTLRNRLTEKFMRPKGDSSHITISQDYYMTSEVSFNGRYALLTQGLWDLNGKEMEGPFINYTFYDENSKRLYMLDGSVYAPKYYKRNLIQQLDVTLQSFMTKAEINSDKQKELLDAEKSFSNGKK